MNEQMFSCIRSVKISLESTFPLNGVFSIVCYRYYSFFRDLASLFNVTYNNDFFPKCDWLLSEFPKINSLRDPSSKMSKSDKSTKSKITLDDPDDVIRKNIRTAVTDFTSEVSTTGDMALQECSGNIVLGSTCALGYIGLYDCLVGQCVSPVMQMGKFILTTKCKTTVRGVGVNKGSRLSMHFLTIAILAQSCLH